MKTRLFFLAGVFSLMLLFAFRFNSIQKQTTPGFNLTEFKKKSIVRCSPDWENLKEWLEETDIPPIPGSGNHQWKISTTNDSAQFYFNQGMNMYYSFHIIEAMASFKKAEKFDPQSAMIHWAQALTYGPNINDYGYVASPEALMALKNANDLSGPVSNMEKGLIYAMSVRYTADSSDVNRAMLNKEYTEIMKRMNEKFPDHPDVQVLYADAMMLEHPWDLWSVNGTPKLWTPLIQEVLEKLLANHPDHPGANHYYIHVMEPSPHFAKALPSANRLGKLTPALSHTVHMPSHIYLRTGNYESGVSVNEDAVKSYQKVLSLFAPVAGNEFLYVMHNLHMQTNNAMLQGRSAYSIESAEATMKSVPEDYLKLEPPLGNYMQYMFMTPVFANIRFGKWDELLSNSEPGSLYPYANVLYHFGRGMAFANKNQLPEAKNELGKLKEWLKDSALFIPMSPFSPVIEGARVAMNMLKGSIAMFENKYEDAIAAYKTASETEENMVYTEPRDWLLNPKHYLGNALLKAAKWQEAENVFLADLKNNNENGWALYGLYLAVNGQNNNSEAANVLKRFNKAFEKADIKITSPVY